jgi:hypothetical protein
MSTKRPTASKVCSASHAQAEDPTVGRVVDGCRVVPTVGSIFSLAATPLWQVKASASLANTHDDQGDINHPLVLGSLPESNNLSFVLSKTRTAMSRTSLHKTWHVGETYTHLMHETPNTAPFCSLQCKKDAILSQPDRS